MSERRQVSSRQHRRPCDPAATTSLLLRRLQPPSSAPSTNLFGQATIIGPATQLGPSSHGSGGVIAASALPSLLPPPPASEPPRPSSTTGPREYKGQDQKETNCIEEDCRGAVDDEAPWPAAPAILNVHVHAIAVFRVVRGETSASAVFCREIQ
nr:unnamed protein product [Digitaria exilis]